MFLDALSISDCCFGERLLTVAKVFVGSLGGFIRVALGGAIREEVGYGIVLAGRITRKA